MKNCCELVEKNNCPFLNCQYDKIKIFLTAIQYSIYTIEEFMYFKYSWFYLLYKIHTIHYFIFILNTYLKYFEYWFKESVMYYGCYWEIYFAVFYHSDSYLLLRNDSCYYFKKRRKRKSKHWYLVAGEK